jgi:hypothetical protein
MIDDDLEYELLRNAEVLNVVLLRDATRQLILSSDHMTPIAHSVRSARRDAWSLIRDAMRRLATPEKRDDPRDRPAGERRWPPDRDHHADRAPAHGADRLRPAHSRAVGLHLRS